MVVVCDETIIMLLVVASLLSMTSNSFEFIDSVIIASISILVSGIRRKGSFLSLIQEEEIGK